MTDHAGPDLSTYSPQPYRPDGGFETSGIGLLFVGLGVGAVLIGWLAHWVSQYFYLILLFPIGIGMVLGIVGNKIIVTSRIRNLWLVALAGLLAGALAMGSSHFLGYLQFQKAFENLPVEQKEFAEASFEEQEKFIATLPEASEKEDMRHFLRAYQAHYSFPAYMNYIAHEGVTISRATRPGDKGINLGFIGSWIYWAIEMAIVAGLLVFMLRDTASAPYCTRCHVWKKMEPGFFWMGNSAVAQGALQSGNLNEVSRLIFNTDIPKEGVSHLQLEYGYCPKCQTMTTCELFLSVKTKDRKGNEKSKSLLKMSYPGNARGDMQKIADHFKTLVNEAPKPA